MTNSIKTKDCYKFQMPKIEYPIDNDHISGLRDIKLASLHYAASVALMVNEECNFRPHKKDITLKRGDAKNLTKFTLLTNIAAYYSINSYLFIETLPTINSSTSLYGPKNQFLGMSKQESRRAKSLTYQQVYQQGIENFETQATLTGISYKIKKLSAEDQARVNYTLYIELIKAVKYGFIPHCYTFAYVADSSQFHFNREFKYLVGTSINDYVKKCTNHIKTNIDENKEYSKIIDIIKKKYSLRDVQSVLFCEEAHLSLKKMRAYLFALGSETYHIMSPFLDEIDTNRIREKIKTSLFKKLEYLTESLEQKLEESASSSLSSFTTSTDNTDNKDNDRKFKTDNKVTKRKKPSKSNKTKNGEIICSKCKHKMTYFADHINQIGFDKISTFDNKTSLNFQDKSSLKLRKLKQEQDMDLSKMEKLATMYPDAVPSIKAINNMFGPPVKFESLNNVYKIKSEDQQDNHIDKLTTGMNIDFSSESNIDSSTQYCGSGEETQEPSFESISLYTTLNDIGFDGEFDININDSSRVNENNSNARNTLYNSNSNSNSYLTTPRTINSASDPSRLLTPNGTNFIQDILINQQEQKDPSLKTDSNQNYNFELNSNWSASYSNA